MINARNILILINVPYAILIIIVYKILMEMPMDYADARMAIMMIIRISYVSNVLNFGYNIK